MLQAGIRSIAVLFVGLTAVSICLGSTSAITEYQLPADSAPFAIVTGPDGALWFTETGTDKIGRLTPQLVFNEYPLTKGSKPYGICEGADGALWFTESGTDKIGRITTSGTIAEFSLTAGAGPHGIAAGPDGNVWFTEFGGNKIGQITPGGTITEFSPLGGNSGLEDITSGPDGNLWYTELNSSRIGRITPTGNVAEFPTNDLYESIAIVTVTDGNLYFTPTSTVEDTLALGQMAPSGLYQYLFNNTSDTPVNPRRLTVGPDHNIWFTNDHGKEFARMALSQKPWVDLYEVLAFPLAPGSGAQGIANGPDGQVWFAESSIDRIGAMAPADFSVETPTKVCNQTQCPPFVEGLGNTSFVALIRNGHDTTSSAFNVSIDWGDGSSPSAGTVAGGPTEFTVAGTHTYAEFGPYDVNITVTRDQFVTAVYHSGITVQDAPIAATTVGPLTATVGIPLAGQFGGFTDGNPNPNMADLTAALLFGDEQCRLPPCYTIATITKSPNGTFLVSSSHTYQGAGTYGYTVAIFDRGYGSGYPFDPAATATSTVTVQPAPDFTLTTSGGSPVLAGQSAGPYTITVNTSNFSGTVGFTCSGLPRGAACAFNPSLLVINGANASTQLMISTTGSRASLLTPRLGRRSSFDLALWLPGFAVGIVGIGGVRRPLVQRHGVAVGLLLLLLIATLGLVSCGGSGSNASQSNPNQTPAGTYVITVNASSGSLNHTTTVTLTVM